MEIEKVIETLGGAAAVASRLPSPKRGRTSITPAAVYKWKRIPAQHVRHVAGMSGGKFSLHDLRPDLYDPRGRIREDAFEKAA